MVKQPRRIVSVSSKQREELDALAGAFACRVGDDLIYLHHPADFQQSDKEEDDARRNDRQLDRGGSGPRVKPALKRMKMDAHSGYPLRKYGSSQP